VTTKIRLVLHKRRLVFLKGAKNIGQVLDISESGVRLLTKAKLVEGESVVVTLKPGESAEPREFPAKVVWARAEKHGGKDYTLAGITFTKNDPVLRDLMHELMYGV